MSGRSDVLCVIPTHDRLALLERAVRSVLQQTRPPSRIVVADDLRDERVRSLTAAVDARTPVQYLAVHEDVAGTAGASRNAGAAAATSEFIAFLDDDDMWDPRFLELTIEKLQSQGVDLVVAWSRLERDGRLLDPPPQMPDRVRLEHVRSRNPGFVGSNFVIRRRAFEQINGFDASLPVFNDLDLLVRLLESGGSYAVVHEQLVTQSSHGGDQLSLRGQRRAAGIRRYMRKHGARADCRARRMLSRELYMAERYPGRSRPTSAYYFFRSWIAAEPSELVRAVRRRLRRMPRAYG